MISKALNGKDGISDELRRTIINTAHEMGYERLPTNTVNRFAFIVSKHFFLETDAFYYNCIIFDRSSYPAGHRFESYLSHTKSLEAEMFQGFFAQERALHFCRAPVLR